MERIDWKRLASILFCLLVLGGLLGMAVRWLLPVMWPFFLAFFLSLVIRPMALRLSELLGIGKRICAAGLFLLFLTGGALLLGALISRGGRELSHLLAGLAENGGEPWWLYDLSPEAIAAFLGRLGRDPAGLPRYEAFYRALSELLCSLQEDLLERLGRGLPRLAGRLMSSFPTFMLTVLITTVAGFYFCTDGDRILQAFSRLLPKEMGRGGIFFRVRQGVTRLLGRYLRVYLSLLTVTFFVLLFGFLILRVRYALILAAVVAIVDLLPILGVGTVLLPWAAMAFLTRNLYLGFGLCILYVAALVLRQIFEPRLLGKSFGLHPLLSLFAVYAGWRWFGVFGMALGPAALLAFQSLFRAFESLGRGEAGADAWMEGFSSMRR